MEFSFSDLCELLTVLHQTDVAELTLKSDEFELNIRKGEAIRVTSPVGSAGNLVVLPTPTPAVAEPSLPSPPSAAPTPPAPASVVDPRWVEITAPMVGTFYRSPAPDEPPYVNKGDRISAGQTVCIVEAMKLMNEIEAEVAGEIVDILVENGQPVEYGQPLMRVNPS